MTDSFKPGNIPQFITPLSTSTNSVAHTIEQGFFASNFAIIKQRFPRAAEKIQAASISDKIEVAQTQQGSVIYLNGQCLDHAEKPVAAGDVWVRQLMSEKRYKEAENVLVFGMGSGYHLESFVRAGKAGLVVVEPSVEVVKQALVTRDLSDLLNSISQLHVGTELPDNLPDNIEYAVRAQSQLIAHEFCQQVKVLSYEKRGFTSLHPKIGVLGPLQGGTLPIAGYTVRSLEQLNQRIRPLDVSGFAGGFHEIKKFLHDDMRKGVIEGHYIEMVSHLLLQSLEEHPIDILICMAQAPISGAALEELRKRGVVTVLWFMEDYLRFTYWQQMARYYDFIFTIQKGECLDLIKQAGAGEVHYLPLACDAMIHRPMQLTSEEKQKWGSPISFVGAGYHNRQQLFASLADHPFKIWGTEWPKGRPFNELVQLNGRRIKPEEYVKIFNATDININLHSSTERDGVDPTGDFVNPRTYELAACGAFQLVDERSLLSEVFEPGKEVITFRDTAELKDKIEYYKDKPEERQAIAERARDRVLREHTYDKRIKQMLRHIYSSKFEHLHAREQQNPWTTMLKRAEPHQELQKRCQVAFQRGEAPNLDALVADIVTGEGKLTETEMKLLFLHHVKKQIITIKREEES